MIKFDIQVVGDREIAATFSHLDEDMRQKVGEKLSQLTNVLYEKVVANVSGKLLQVKSGQLAGSIVQRIDTASAIMVGEVTVEPMTPQAVVHEIGGEGYYDIFPTKAAVLRFVAKSGDIVFAAYVRHPPAEPKEYLLSALREIEPEVEDGFFWTVDEVLAAVWRT